MRKFYVTYQIGGIIPLYSIRIELDDYKIYNLNNSERVIYYHLIEGKLTFDGIDIIIDKILTKSKGIFKKETFKEEDIVIANIIEIK